MNRPSAMLVLRVFAPVATLVSLIFDPLMEACCAS
jgi:hypothetical protein